jgi:hypothetical protein
VPDEGRRTDGETERLPAFTPELMLAVAAMHLAALTRVELGLDASAEDALARAQALHMRAKKPAIRNRYRPGGFDPEVAKADFQVQTWFEEVGPVLAEFLRDELRQRSTETGAGPRAAWLGIVQALEEMTDHAKFMAERTGATIVKRQH